MDYLGKAKQLLGLGGGVSSHQKNKFRPRITPEMRLDANRIEEWTKTGRTSPLYKKFGSNPKAT